MEKIMILGTRKCGYLLNEQDVLEILTNEMSPPENWVKKYRCARFTMLSSMHNVFIGEFENCATT